MDGVMGHLSGFAGSASAALLSSIWQGLVLAVGVGVCLRMVPRLSAAVRSGVWLAVFLIVGMLDLMGLAGVGGSSPVGVVRLDPRWGMGLAGVWAAVALVRMSRLVAGGLRLAAVARRAVPLGEAVRSGRREPLVCSSAEVDRPGVFGFFKPRILLPAGLCERLSPTELEAVLLHEREHLRRGDDWTNLLQKIGLALMPLNPVLVWVERRLCRERELACDDRVLHETRARKAYAACLARLAEDAMLQKPLALALGIAGRGSELARRVHRILARPEASLGRGTAAGVSGLMILGLLGGGLELARCPQVVSFSPRDYGMASYGVPGISVPGAERKVSMGGAARIVNTVARMDAPAAVHEPRRMGRPVRVVKRSAPARQQRNGWIVLTRWAVEGAGEPVFAPVQVAVPVGYSISSYASVPVGNGWLVFQL